MQWRVCVITVSVVHAHGCNTKQQLMNAWRHHDTATLFASLAGEGNPQARLAFPSPKKQEGGPWCFLRCQHKQTARTNCPVTGVSMMLMICHCTEIPIFEIKRTKHTLIDSFSIIRFLLSTVDTFIRMPLLECWNHIVHQRYILTYCLQIDGHFVEAWMCQRYDILADRCQWHEIYLKLLSAAQWSYDIASIRQWFKNVSG